MRILLLLCLLAAGPVWGQHRLIDSLQTELSRDLSDSMKVEIHCQLSKQFALSDIKKAQAHAHTALALATRAHIPTGQAKALHHLGRSYLQLGHYGRAVKHHFQALKIGEQTGDTAIVILSYNHLGLMSGKMKDWARSQKYFQTAVRLAKMTDNKDALGKVLNNLGDMLERQKKYPQAMPYYRQAAALQRAAGDSLDLAISLLNIGNLHLFVGRPADGLPYLFESYRLDEQVHNIMTQVVTLGSIAKIYRTLGDHASALVYAHRANNMALLTGSDKKMAIAYQLLHQLYADRGNYHQAYKYQSDYIRHQDSLDIANQQQVTAEITARYETHKKNLENQKLKAEQEKQAVLIAHQQIKQLFGTGVLVLLVIGLLLLFQSRKRLQTTYQALQQANNRREIQHQEISRQKNALTAQALVLQTQNEQLEKLNAFRNKLFTIISHDLRTPFSSIRSILNMGEGLHFSEEEIRQIFDLLGQDIDAANTMLNNLLGWSKAQLNGSTLHLELVNLQQLAAENIKLVNSQAALKQIHLYNEVPVHLVASTDKERLNFVLRNLILNAIKFTPEGGVIRLQGQEKNGNAVIAVCDNGQGISPKNINRLFTEERFTTLGTAREKGTGLGLMLSKEFIESLNGDIAVESVEQQGTIFQVTLPLAQPVAATVGALA